MPSSIIALRALHIGDMLCAVPAFRALRAGAPRARIVLAGLPWARSFVRRFRRYFDGFIEFPGYPGLPERAPDIFRFPDFVSEIQRQSFDLALQLHGSGSFVNPLILLFGARFTAGFYAPGSFCPDPRLFCPYPAQETEIRRNLLLAQFLGFPSAGERLEFPLEPEDYHTLELIPETRKLRTGDYACLHPGARFESRRWPAERFADIGDRLAAAGLAVVVTGTEDEADIAGQVCRRMKSHAVNLAGCTGIGALGALLKGARLLVANDTGVSHIADALDTPSVIVVTGSDPWRWQPFQRPLHRTVCRPAACRPCEFASCPRGHECALAVTADDVWRQAARLLSQTTLHPAGVCA